MYYNKQLKWNKVHSINKIKFNDLTRIYQNAKTHRINSRSKILILSDFHLGNRKSRDDFVKNSNLCIYLLKQYADNNFTLILNGDIEELHRVSLTTIQRKWFDLYELFGRFASKNRLIKIIGNHDADLTKHNNRIIGKLFNGIILLYKKNRILVFHGHQPSGYINTFQNLSKIFLRYIANPLRIKNISRTYENNRILKTEKAVYDFSKSAKIVSIIGHTHRPLFESLSEIDMLKYKIEHLLRIYPTVNPKDKKNIRESLELYKRELIILHKENTIISSKEPLYNQDIVMPYIFNSGCVIGKRGVNGIVIENGTISLMQWFTSAQKKKYYKYHEAAAKLIPGTDFYKMNLRSDNLDYIFNRINFLG